MPIDINAAERFVHAAARLLDRHRLAVLLHGAPVLDALRAYRNPAADSATPWSPTFALPRASRPRSSTMDRSQSRAEPRTSG